VDEAVCAYSKQTRAAGQDKLGGSSSSNSSGTFANFTCEISLLLSFRQQQYPRSAPGTR
jgi:hypothetical protein